MEEMVQRTEANLQQMQALLAEAKANQATTMTLNDELIRRIAEEVASNFKNNMYPSEMVEMDTSISGMEITVELDWEWGVISSIKELVIESINEIKENLSCEQKN